MKKIYCFVNRRDAGGVVAMAMCEDGHVVGLHYCSSEFFAKADMGLVPHVANTPDGWCTWKATSEGHRKEYAKHCPGGYDLEWVDDVRGHEGLMAAYELNQKLGREAKGACPT